MRAVDEGRAVDSGESDSKKSEVRWYGTRRGMLYLSEVLLIHAGNFKRCSRWECCDRATESTEL